MERQGPSLHLQDRKMSQSQSSRLSGNVCSPIPRTSLRAALPLRSGIDGRDHPPDGRAASMVGADGLEPPTSSV